MEAANLEPPSEEEFEAFTAEIAGEVRDTIREGWTIFQLIADHNIGSANCLLLQEPITKGLNFRFTKKTTDYQLEGELQYTS